MLTDLQHVPGHILMRISRLQSQRGAVAERLAKSAAYDAWVRRRDRLATVAAERRYLEGELARLRNDDIFAHARVHRRVAQLKTQLGE